MQVDVSLSDGETENAQSFDENHDFVYAGNWCMIQDYYGNFTAKQFRSGEGNSIVVYHSPENEEKEYDSGYRGVAVTERSVLYTIYDKRGMFLTGIGMTGKRDSQNVWQNRRLPWFRNMPRMSMFM